MILLEDFIEDYQLLWEAITNKLRPFLKKYPQLTEEELEEYLKVDPSGLRAMSVPMMLKVRYGMQSQGGPKIKGPKDITEIIKFLPHPGYLPWYLKQMALNQLIYPEDLEQSLSILNVFERYKEKVIWKAPKDINQYKTLGDLLETIQKITGIDKRKKQKATPIKPGADLVYEDNLFRVISVSPDADGKKFMAEFCWEGATKGDNTQLHLARAGGWCVKAPSFMDSYIKADPNKEPFYIIERKSDQKVHLLHFNSQQIKDSRNVRITVENAAEMRPTLSALFPQKSAIFGSDEVVPGNVVDLLIEESRKIIVHNDSQFVFFSALNQWMLVERGGKKQIFKHMPDKNRRDMFLLTIRKNINKVVNEAFLTVKSNVVVNTYSDLNVFSSTSPEQWNNIEKRIEPEVAALTKGLDKKVEPLYDEYISRYLESYPKLADNIPPLRDLYKKWLERKSYMKKKV